jgi:hypothetical protein
MSYSNQLYRCRICYSLESVVRQRSHLSKWLVPVAQIRTELITVEAVDGNTSFGAYANRFIQESTGGAAVHASVLDAREVLDL